MEHKEQKVVCQNCEASFTIEPEDFGFYEKMNVPAPTWCPECRMTRRLSFGNAWGVYFRNCDKCDKKTLTMYRPEDPTIVYCDPCWWADDWDGTEYATNYDPDRNFLEQWRELRMKTPHFAKDASYSTLKNCEYTNAIAFSKNCYLTFWADYCENVFYSTFLNEVKDCIDVLRVYKSELCYESVGLGRCSRTFFSNECDDCVDVWFSRNCYGCTNCVGCVNQSGAKYKIFNEQYSKEDYFKKLKELKLDTRNGIFKTLERATEFWRSLPYREYTGNAQNLNVLGDYLYECKNAKYCYMCSGAEDSKYCQFVSVPKATNCMDYYGWGDSASQMYECATSGQGVDSLKFCFGSFADCLNSEYCGYCIGSKNNFGCANLKRKKYCILNKEYSKEEYEKLRTKIIEDMSNNPYIDSLGRVYKYGEFFAPELSPFPYNDSNANKFFEKNKEQATSEGYKWLDIKESDHLSTIDGRDLPSTASAVSDNICKEVIGCVSCGKGFKITKGEVGLYKKLTLTLPENCPKCREKRRFSLVNMPHIRDTQCDKCDLKIQTMHPEGKKRVIYCEKCYQQEVY